MSNKSFEINLWVTFLLFSAAMATQSSASEFPSCAAPLASVHMKELQYFANFMWFLWTLGICLFASDIFEVCTRNGLSRRPRILLVCFVVLQLFAMNQIYSIPTRADLANIHDSLDTICIPGDVELDAQADLDDQGASSSSVLPTIEQETKSGPESPSTDASSSDLPAVEQETKSGTESPSTDSASSALPTVEQETKSDSSSSVPPAEEQETKIGSESPSTDSTTNDKSDSTKEDTEESTTSSTNTKTSSEPTPITEEECMKDSAACFIRCITTGVCVQNPTYNFEAAPAYLQTKQTMQKISEAINEKTNRDLEWRRNLIYADDDDDESLEEALQKFRALPAPPPNENRKKADKEETKNNENSDNFANPSPIARDDENESKNTKNFEKRPKNLEKRNENLENQSSKTDENSESESGWRVNPLLVAVPIVAAGVVVAWYPTQCLGIVDTYVRPAIDWLHRVVF